MVPLCNQVEKAERLDRILSFQLGDSQPCRGKMKIVKFEKACGFFDFMKKTCNILSLALATL